jgi:hypothetical protein
MQEVTFPAGKIKLKKQEIWKNTTPDQSKTAGLSYVLLSQERELKN